VNNFTQTAVGVLVGGLVLGAFLHAAGKQGLLGPQIQAFAKYVNEGFAVDF